MRVLMCIGHLETPRILRMIQGQDGIHLWFVWTPLDARSQNNLQQCQLHRIQSQRHIATADTCI